MAAAPNDPYSDVPTLDPSRKAAEHLNDLIDDAGEIEDMVIVDEKLRAHAEALRERAREEEELEAQIAESIVPVDEVRTGASVLEIAEDRDTVRLLIFTKNVALRQLGSLAQRRLVDLGKVFAEIHVIILNQKSAEETVPAVRLTDNIWLYSTESKKWWRTGFDAYRIANEQLNFAGGFRADVIIAEDPFESGMAAYYVAEKYNRPFQVHILEDIYEPTFKEREEHNGLRLWLAKRVFKHTDCVRTNSDYLRSHIVKDHPDLEPHIEVLPIYHNLEAWRDMTPTTNLRERYPQYKFIILHVSGMNARSHTREVLQGVAPILRTYKTVGLVVIGNGPYRSALEKMAIALGVATQVQFEPVPDEVISHMKSANVFVHLSDDPIEDTLVLEAAAVKIPMIASEESIAGTLFVDNESAFICKAADAACVSYRIRSYLNDNQARSRLAMNAQEVVFERIEQDYNAFLHAYRDSVERCIVMDN